MGARPRCRVLAAAALALPALAAVIVFPGTASAASPLSPARPPALTAEPVAPASLGATSAGVSLQLTSLTPAVVRPGEKLVVTGTVHNDSGTALAKSLVRVVVGRTASSREDVRAWAAETGPADGVEVGRTRLAGDLAPGGTGSFTVTVSGLAGRSSATYGALPLSVQTGTTSVRTFAGFQRIKQYQPMSIAWAVPLTLDPDPDLFGANGPAREAAWQQALGAGSRVSRVLDATSGSSVTWAIDPTLTPSLITAGIDTPPNPSDEQSLRRSTETLISSEAAAHTPWVLPDTDADVGAVAGSGQGEPLMETLVTRAAPVAKALGGRADIAWPADGAYTSAAEAGLRRMFRNPALAGQVTATGALQPAVSGTTPPAVQRSATGLPLLSYDQALSALFARTTSAGEAVLSTQQFVAESAALLNELPGTAGRTVFVVAPRSFNPDPASAQRFLAATMTIPWLTPTTTNAELASAKRTATTSGAPVTRPSTPSAAGGPPVLTTARLTALSANLATVQGVALIRDDGQEFRRTWTRAAEQLASTRWRGAPTAWNTLGGRVVAATRETTTAVKVSAGTINFLAESGRLQITVTNDLDVPVKAVKLTVEASNPRLRIDSQPSILRIGPKSRATVNVSVTALAAGLVPLRTTLTTPDGTVIGQGADVLVRVTPTGSWVYWGLGGLAVAILLLGVVRSLRRRPSRASRLGPLPPATPGAPTPGATRPPTADGPPGQDQPAAREARG